VRIDARETTEEVGIELAADVLFDFDKADIRSDVAATLTEAAEFHPTKEPRPGRGRRSFR
jgi:outer membrane protein OmpA-like peptidoglycan-associated protein